MRTRSPPGRCDRSLNENRPQVAVLRGTGAEIGGANPRGGSEMRDATEGATEGVREVIIPAPTFTER